MERAIIHPYIPIIIGVLSILTSAIFVKLAEAGMLAFYRILISVLIMSPIFLSKYVHELKLLTKQD